MQTKEASAPLSVWGALQRAKPTVTLHRLPYHSRELGVKVHFATTPPLSRYLTWEEELYGQYAIIVLAEPGSPVAGVIHPSTEATEMNALFRPEREADFGSLYVFVDRAFKGCSNAAELIVLRQDRGVLTLPNQRPRRAFIRAPFS